jgi:hypothetical protein
MFRNHSITLALALFLSPTVGSSFARAQDQPAAPAANSDKSISPAQDASNPQGPATNVAKANDAPKPAAKTHHVVTNEDIEAQHERMASANSDIDIGNINDCDKNCFDWVRNSSNYYIVRNTDWKRDLLHGIEQVTDDPKWQSALYQIARLKARFCEMNQNKNDALVDTADPKKMTEDQIEIEESYERRFQAAQADLNAAYANADSVIHTYGGIVVAFMNMQKQRAGNRTCVIRYPMMYPGYRVPTDDPDRP